MASRNFDEWLSKLKETIYDYDYYVDYLHATKKASEHRKQMELLNTLSSSVDLDRDFINLVQEHPEIKKSIPILLAIRNTDIPVNDNGNVILYDFQDEQLTPAECLNFVKKTGLYDMIKSGDIGNFHYYLLGVEVGLDSNARKNRGGKTMEHIVDSFLKETGVEYYEQRTLKLLEQNGIVIPKTIPEDIAIKLFDFIVVHKNHLFGIETNFYGSSGSKLNETARSYKMLAQESEKIDGFTFIWITDGKGWQKTRNILHDTFNSMETIYNLNDLENGLLDFDKLANDSL